MQTRLILLSLAVLGSILGLQGEGALAQKEPPELRPAATIDLTTSEGTRLVKGEWRYSDTKIVEVMHRKPGPDGQPTGEPVQTYDYTPHAGGADFDDSRWEVVEPAALSRRRSTGRLCFNWYRLRITIPERIGGFDPTGSTAVFETVLDDYAEVWVDGELERAWARAAAPSSAAGMRPTGWSSAGM